MDKIDKEVAGLGLSLLSTASTALFAGGALYINRVEHPARMTHDPATAITIWKPSFLRAAKTQVSYGWQNHHFLHLYHKQFRIHFLMIYNYNIGC